MVGHSFNQCDRNFGLYGRKIKKMKKVESVKEYVEIIEACPETPFTVVQDNEYELNNYENIFSDLPLSKQKMIQISKQRKIVFYPNNKIGTFASYDSKPMRHEILVTNFDEITKIYC